MRPVRWVVALLDSRHRPARNRRHRRRQCQPRPSHAAWRSAGCDRRSRTNTPKRCARRTSSCDVAERRQKIRKALDAATRTVPGARWREDEALVETVIHLTEWPSVILGNFEAEYLAAAGGSSGHRDARPPEVFRRGRCERQAGAAFSRRAQYAGRCGGRGDHPPRQRARAAGALQRRAASSGTWTRKRRWPSAWKA